MSSNTNVPGSMSMGVGVSMETAPSVPTEASMTGNPYEHITVNVNALPPRAYLDKVWHGWYR